MMTVIPLLCIALLALLSIGLGFWVSMMRVRAKASYGAEADPKSDLYKAQRAHGNTIEFAPILAIIIYALGQQTQPLWVYLLMLAVTASRFLLAGGLLLPKTMARPNRLRFAGALGTYLFGLALALVLLIQASL